MWGTSKARSSGEQNGVYFENGKSVCVANYCQRLCWQPGAAGSKCVSNCEGDIIGTTAVSIIGERHGDC